jgi:hypothetical protein
MFQFEEWTVGLAFNECGKAVEIDSPGYERSKLSINKQTGNLYATFGPVAEEWPLLSYYIIYDEEGFFRYSSKMNPVKLCKGDIATVIFPFM